MMFMNVLFLNQESKMVTLKERYRDSEAFMNHGVNISTRSIFEKHFQDFMRIYV